MSNTQGLIFDMDGTMVDNMMVHHRAWQKQLASLGIYMSLEEVKAQIHGVNEEILERLFGDRFSAQERKSISAEKEAAYRSIFAPELRLISGLLDFLDQALEKDVPMAIGTAAPPENANFILDNLQLHKYFKGIVHARNVKRGKPDPETFILAAATLDLAPEQCLVFEDSIAGAQTALNAGCQAVIVTTTHSREEFSAYNHIVRFINDFTEITLEDVLPILTPS